VPTLNGNGCFSLSVKFYNPSINDKEPIVTWTERREVDSTNALLVLSKEALPINALGVACKLLKV